MGNLSLSLNIIAILLTVIGLFIGFINEEYRLLTWTLSFLVIVVIILFIIFRTYVSQIEENTNEIRNIKKSLNIEKRLTILETKLCV